MIVAFQYVQIYEFMLTVKNRHCNSSSIAAQLLYHPMQVRMVNYTNKVISSIYLVFVPHLRKKVGLCEYCGT
jgi:hypothetical protein